MDDGGMDEIREGDSIVFYDSNSFLVVTRVNALGYLLDAHRCRARCTAETLARRRQHRRQVGFRTRRCSSVLSFKIRGRVLIGASSSFEGWCTSSIVVHGLLLLELEIAS